MRIALTGTPGTGKSTVAALLPYKVIDINALVKSGLYLSVDDERGCLEADMEGLERRLEELEGGEGPDRGKEQDQEEGLDRQRELDQKERMRDREKESDQEEICILEGHFSHRLAEWAIVLRLSPEVLRRRLLERGYSERKVRENLEAEALDIVLAEAVECCRRVDEIDTTELTPQEVSGIVERIIRGELRLPPGQVDWLEEFFGYC
jgi:adenylate kinase